MPPAIERLEERKLLNSTLADPFAAADGAAPLLQSVRVLGPWQAATGLAVTFSEPMDPATAADVSSYRVWGTTRIRAFDRDLRKLPLDRAEYDDATRTVTLSSTLPTFGVRRYLRTVLVRRTVTDAAGNALGGERDPVGNDDFPDGYIPFLFRPARTKRAFNYFDGNRSQVRLRLQGPGRVTLLLRAQDARLKRDTYAPTAVETWGEGLQVFVDGATPQSVLTGTVATGPNGVDAITSLLEIVNPAGAQIALLDDPAFIIGAARG